jgi:hypothetical protein
LRFAFVFAELEPEGMGAGGMDLFGAPLDILRRDEGDRGES